MCFECLKDGGLIVLKDNIAGRGRKNGFVLDKSDSSVMRSDQYLKSLFALAGARIISESVQSDFPQDTFPVKAYALVRQSAPGERPLKSARQANRTSAP